MRKVTYEKKKFDNRCILKLTDYTEKDLKSMLSVQDEEKFKPFLARIE